MNNRITQPSSLWTFRDLLEWNDVLPNFRMVRGPVAVNPTYMIVADYGWAERILCSGCYEDAAVAILAALNEAVSRV